MKINDTNLNKSKNTSTILKITIIILCILIIILIVYLTKMNKYYDIHKYNSDNSSENIDKNEIIDDKNQQSNADKDKDYIVSINNDTFVFTKLNNDYFEDNSICDLMEFNKICSKYINEPKNKYYEEDSSTQMSFLILNDNNSIIDKYDIKENIKYRIVDEYEFYKNNFTKLFEKDNYIVYKDSKGIFSNNEEDYFSGYLVIDTKEKAKFETYKDNNLDNIYEFLVDCSVLGIFDIKNKLITDEYREYSCGFHSDIQLEVCNSDITIIGKWFSKGKDEYEKFGLFSLKNFKTIVDAKYDNIVAISGNKYLVSNNSKYGIIDNKGNEIFKLEYDYIGENTDDLGYVFIKDNIIELYNGKLEKIDLSEISFKDYYEKSLEATNKKNKTNYDSIFLGTAESWYWSAGSEVGIYDINKPFDYDSYDKIFSYKYTGKDYSGNQLIIRSKCSDYYMFVIDGNNAYKIDKKYIIEGEGDTSCF